MPRVDNKACLELWQLLCNPNNAFHAVRESLGTELCQNDGEDSILIVAQQVLIYTLTCNQHNYHGFGASVPVCIHKRVLEHGKLHSMPWHTNFNP